MIIKPILHIDHLEVSNIQGQKSVPLVHDVSFSLYKGETVALTGTSGCGKSITAHALVGMLDSNFQVTNGHIYYKDENILTYDEKKWQKLRREEIGLLIQHSLSGLNPIRTVKKQMVEALKQNKKSPYENRETYLHTILEQVGFSDPAEILSSYPFELSGGMRQRVLLAMLISLRPQILIADEPTTALDVINREKVLQLLKKLQHELGLTILLISHDQHSVKKLANRVLQMNPGGILQ
ncbi:ABC transporter ATP-binding protein [Alkalihalobacillus sp. BA299]|uniref:ATP-binding cassette domain-containing protein n=1 Tax=Alkalihalobacillus sp. BA299 TaxID=2815938 RepID=UPI001ADB843F|nr:ABC transporter ATP-binding protein [Alkalihalobacillus sp. BA299]